MTMGEKGAEGAVQALKPAAVLPIHLAVTPRSPLLRSGDTPQGFARRLRQAGLETDVVVLRAGESWAI
jgi:L-ascorbate metabolism protein UlaG (beta-lactamase superfamily)